MAWIEWFSRLASSVGSRPQLCMNASNAKARLRSLGHVFCLRWRVGAAMRCALFVDCITCSPGTSLRASAARPRSGLGCFQGRLSARAHVAARVTAPWCRLLAGVRGVCVGLHRLCFSGANCVRVGCKGMRAHAVSSPSRLAFDSFLAARMCRALELPFGANASLSRLYSARATGGGSAIAVKMSTTSGHFLSTNGLTLLLTRVSCWRAWGRPASWGSGSKNNLACNLRTSRPLKRQREQNETGRRPSVFCRR